MSFSILQLAIAGESLLFLFLGLVFYIAVLIKKVNANTAVLDKTGQEIQVLGQELEQSEEKEQDLRSELERQKLVLEQELATYRDKLENLEQFKQLYLKIDAKARSMTTRAIELTNSLLRSVIDNDWDSVSDIGSQLESELRSLNPFIDGLEVPEGDHGISFKEKNDDTKELQALVKTQMGLIQSLQDAIKSKKLDGAEEGLSDIERLMVESGRIIEALGNELAEAKAALESQQQKADATQNEAISLEETESSGYSETLENRIKALEKDNKEANNEIESLHKKLESAQHKFDLAKSMHADEGDVKSLEEKLKEKEDELEAQHASYAKLEEEYMRLFSGGSA